MPFVYLDTDQVFLDTAEVILGAPPEDASYGPVGFEVYRNGDLQDILWSRHQLLSISLAMVAYDGEIGQGSVTLPGAPDRDTGWWIGDRISFVDPISGKILYTGYLSSPRVGINIDSLDELETSWTLQDVNRHLIGHAIQDLTQPFDFDVSVISDQIIAMISGDGPPQPTVNDDWVESSGAVFPPTTWNSDGAVDMINQVIQYLGWTVYLGLTDTENVLDLHIHPLPNGPSAGINIDDTSGVATGLPGDDTFAPSLNSILTWDTTDLKDGVTGVNGVTSVPGPVSSGVYEDGGLRWEAVLDYGSLSEDSLVAATNSVITNGSIPKKTLTTTIGPLVGSQVADCRPGSSIALTTVLGTLDFPRIGRETLTVTRDVSGNPLKGLWDLALEIGFPLRGPTAVTGFGGQGNAAGALSTFHQWTRTQVFEDDPAIALDEQETVTAQLIDDFGIAQPVPDVELNWSVVKDDSDTPHPDYIVLVTPTLTDQSGQATATVVKTSETDSSKHRVKAEP